MLKPSVSPKQAPAPRKAMIQHGIQDLPRKERCGTRDRLGHRDATGSVDDVPPPAVGHHQDARRVVTAACGRRLVPVANGYARFGRSMGDDLEPITLEDGLPPGLVAVAVVRRTDGLERRRKYQSFAGGLEATAIRVNASIRQSGVRSTNT